MQAATRGFKHGGLQMRIAALEAMRDADEAADSIVRMAIEMIRAGAPSNALTCGPPRPLRG